MDTGYLILSLIILLLIGSQIYLFFFYLPEKQKKQKETDRHLKNSLKEEITHSLKSQEEIIKLRLENLSESLGREIKSSSEILSQINQVLLAPARRGKLGNAQLEQLLSLYLPKNDKVYQL